MTRKVIEIKVEVFTSPDCSKCARASEVLRNLVAELCGDRIHWREVNILEDLDYAVALGVLATPSIAIDGKLVFTGLPTTAKLRATLLERLNGKG